VIRKLSLEDNGWLINDEKIEPLWFVGCQLPPSSKLTKEIPVPQHESDADIDSDVEKPKRRRTQNDRKSLLRNKSWKLELTKYLLQSSFI
jgi:hypothetical protein